MSIQAGSSIFAAESHSTDLFVSNSPPNSASSCDVEPLTAPESLGFGFRSLACRVRRKNIAASTASPTTVPVMMIPTLAPVLRPVFGVDEDCGKTVIVSGEVLDEESVKGLKEVDAEDIMVEACDVMLEARDIIVEARYCFVEESSNESDDTEVYEDTVNCSGEGASKVSWWDIEQSSPPALSQQDHKLLVPL